MSTNEDLSFLKLPTFKTFKVKSGRTYIQLDEVGHSIAVSFSSWKDQSTGDAVTGVIIRPVIRAQANNVDLLESAVEAGAVPDAMDKLVRKKKTYQPTHWGFASPQDVLTALEGREFFVRLVNQLNEAYSVSLDPDQFKNVIIVSDNPFSQAILKDFREVVAITL